MSVVEAMQEYVDAGFTTFDMADIYGPAEEIFGQFNSQVSVYTEFSITYTSPNHHSSYFKPLYIVR